MGISESHFKCGIENDFWIISSWIRPLINKMRPPEEAREIGKSDKETLAEMDLWREKRD